MTAEQAGLERATTPAGGGRVTAAPIHTAMSALRSYRPIEVLERCPRTGRPLTVRLPTGTLAH